MSLFYNDRTSNIDIDLVVIIIEFIFVQIFNALSILKYSNKYKFNF